MAAPQQHSKLRRLVRGGVTSGATATAQAKQPPLPQQQQHQQHQQQQQQPQAKNQASSRGSLSPDDDLLAGFSNLVLGSGPRPAAPSGSGALPAKPTSAIAATATSSYTSAAGAAAAAAATSGQGRAGRQVGAPAAAVLVPAFVAGREEQGDDEEEEDLDDSDSQDEVEDDEGSDDGSKLSPSPPPRRPACCNSSGAAPPAAQRQPHQPPLEQRSVAPSSLFTQRQQHGQSVSSDTDGDSDGGRGGRDDGSDDDAEERAFFERIAPSADAVHKATAAAAAGAAAAKDPAQEPGALVLRSAVDPGRKPYVLAAGVACRLYPHQVVGVRWLWSLYDMQRGGILGDDMVRGRGGAREQGMRSGAGSKAALSGKQVLLLDPAATGARHHRP